MPIHFTKERMAQVLRNHDLWWKGKLGRPLIRATITDAYPRGEVPKAPILAQENIHDFSWSPEEVVKAWEWELSGFEYLADAYPVVDLACFGPGVLAAFCGAKLDNSSGRVWFFPCEEDVTKLSIRYDPENIWARRIKDICRAGIERWQGSVIITMPDLGGIMDVIASMCGTENLLYATMDEPEEVHRLILEAEAAWQEAYTDFAKILAPQGCMTNWNGILSSESTYIPQCDFAYMIGPDMFREFVLETLRKDTERMENTIYHLDGIGQLAHLDMLLSLPKLKAIQWVPGDGKPGPETWSQVYERIRAAGKNTMIVGDARSNGSLQFRDMLGSSLYTATWASKAERDDVVRYLEEMGVPVK